MEKIIFRKDNCLTKFNEYDFINEGIKNSFKNLVDVFGEKNVFIFTNSFTQDESYLKGIKDFGRNLDKNGFKRIKFFNVKIPIEWEKLKNFVKLEYNCDLS